MNYELITTIVGLASLGIALYVAQKGNVKAQKEQTKEFTMIAERVSSNIKDITDLQQEMKNVKENQLRANEAITSKFEQAITKVADTEVKYHNEIMDEIKNLSIKITAICSTFEEYRKTRNEKAVRE